MHRHTDGRLLESHSISSPCGPSGGSGELKSNTLKISPNIVSITRTPYSYISVDMANNAAIDQTVPLIWVLAVLSDHLGKLKYLKTIDYKTPQPEIQLCFIEGIVISLLFYLDLFFHAKGIINVHDVCKIMHILRYCFRVGITQTCPCIMQRF